MSLFEMFRLKINFQMVYPPVENQSLLLIKINLWMSTAVIVDLSNTNSLHPFPLNIYATKLDDII